MLRICLKIVISLSLLLSPVLTQQTTNANNFKKNTFGLGLGIPYGCLGANIDINAAANVNLSIGIGTTILNGIAYNFGLKYFLSPIKHKFRPKISAYYGVNTVVHKIYLFSDRESETDIYQGFSFAIGAQWMWGKCNSKGLDFDIIYIASRNWDENKIENISFEESENIKFSIGFRHSF